MSDQNEQLYQQGRFPSVIDTDDLVFEIGIQRVGNINKEKIIDNLTKRVKDLEKVAMKAVQDKKEADERVAPLEESNIAYVKNNQRLDAEMCRLRTELEMINATKLQNKGICKCKNKAKKK